MKATLDSVNNKVVNRIGQDIAYKVMRRAQVRVSRGMVNLYVEDEKGAQIPAFVWTKTHQKRVILGHVREITGKDEDRLKKLYEAQQKHGEIWLVWVDALLGIVMGGPMRTLLKPSEFEDLTYPHVETTHSGKITYFNIHLIPTIGEIPEEDLEGLRKVLALNRSPKGQQSLGI